MLSFLTSFFLCLGCFVSGIDFTARFDSQESSVEAMVEKTRLILSHFSLISFIHGFGFPWDHRFTRRKLNQQINLDSSWSAIDSKKKNESLPSANSWDYRGNMALHISTMAFSNILAPKSLLRFLPHRKKVENLSRPRTFRKRWFGSDQFFATHESPLPSGLRIAHVHPWKWHLVLGVWGEGSEFWCFSLQFLRWCQRHLRNMIHFFIFCWLPRTSPYETERKTMILLTTQTNPLTTQVLLTRFLFLHKHQNMILRETKLKKNDRKKNQGFDITKSNSFFWGHINGTHVALFWSFAKKMKL